MTYSFRSTELSAWRTTVTSGPHRTRDVGFPHAPGTLRRVEAVTTESRLRALLEATLAIGSESSLESLLLRLVNTAAELTSARYAALGVIDPTGRQLERF